MNREGRVCRSIDFDPLTHELLNVTRETLKEELGQTVSTGTVVRRALRLYAEHVAALSTAEDKLKEQVQINAAKGGR